MANLFLLDRSSWRRGASTAWAPPPKKKKNWWPDTIITKRHRKDESHPEKAKISSIALIHNLHMPKSLIPAIYKKYTKRLSYLWYHSKRRRLGSSVVGPMRKCTDEFEGWVGVVPTPTPAAWLPILLVRHCKALPLVSPAGLNQLMHPKFLLGHLGHLQWPPQPCMSCQAYLVITKPRGLAPDPLARSV